MEYLKVTFPSRRFVYIDGEQNGCTNDVLRVDAGTHIVELGKLDNYRSGSRKVLVQDTTVLDPLEVAFSFVRTKARTSASANNWPVSADQEQAMSTMAMFTIVQARFAWVKAACRHDVAMMSPLARRTG